MLSVPRLPARCPCSRAPHQCDPKAAAAAAPHHRHASTVFNRRPWARWHLPFCWLSSAAGKGRDGTGQDDGAPARGGGSTFSSGCHVFFNPQNQNKPNNPKYTNVRDQHPSALPYAFGATGRSQTLFCAAIDSKSHYCDSVSGEELLPAKPSHVFCLDIQHAGENIVESLR